MRVVNHLNCCWPLGPTGASTGGEVGPEGREEQRLKEKGYNMWAPTCAMNRNLPPPWTCRCCAKVGKEVGRRAEKPLRPTARGSGNKPHRPLGPARAAPRAQGWECCVLQAKGRFTSEPPRTKVRDRKHAVCLDPLELSQIHRARSTACYKQREGKPRV